MGIWIGVALVAFGMIAIASGTYYHYESHYGHYSKPEKDGWEIL